MKKVPKIPKKKYADGTPAAGVQELDKNGNPVISNNAKIKDSTVNGLGALGQSYYATQTPTNEGDVAYNTGMGALSNFGTIGKAISGISAVGDAIGKPIRKKAEGINEATGDYNNIDRASNTARVGALVNPFKSFTTIVSDPNASGFQKGVAIATGGAGNSLFMKDYYQGKENARKKELAEGSAQDAVVARDNSETFTMNGGSNYQPTPTKEDQFKQKFKNIFAKGGEIKGAGTGTSDSINAEIKKGAFVVPAVNAPFAKKVRKEVLGDNPNKKASLKQGKSSVPVKVSNGEHLFSPEEKKEIEEELGEDFLKSLAPEAEEGDEKAKGGELSAEKAKTMLKDNQANGQPLTPAQKRYFGWIAGGRKMKGGEVSVGLSEGGDVMDDETDPNKITSKTPTTVKYTKPVAKTTTKKTKNNIFSQQQYIPKQELPANTLSTMIDQDALKANNPSSNKVDTTPIADVSNSTPPEQKNNFWNNVASSGALDYAIGAAQTGIGLKNLQGSKRPVFALDKTFAGNVDKAQQQAQYGFTPEQNYLIDQQNKNLLNQEIFAAKNYAGGSAANAYNMTRSATNNAFNRGLEKQVAGTNLQLDKQTNANNLLLQKNDINRQIFNDSMNAFLQKQTSAGNLTNTGLQNILSANRFQNFMKLRQEENKFNNPYLNTGK